MTARRRGEAGRAALPMALAGQARAQQRDQTGLSVALEGQPAPRNVMDVVKESFGGQAIA